MKNIKVQVPGKGDLDECYNLSQQKARQRELLRELLSEYRSKGGTIIELPPGDAWGSSRQPALKAKKARSKKGKYG